jgi:hypothetical protein
LIFPGQCGCHFYLIKTNQGGPLVKGGRGIELV